MLDSNNNLNIETDRLKKKIENLKIELDKKDLEIYEYLGKIENLEDRVMKLELLIPDEDENKKSKKQKKVDSKLTLEIEERDVLIRNLKDRMGFLRKEKTQLQQQLENERANNPNSSVMRVEELRSKPPLEVLVNELQDKVNKYKIVIDQLKRESIDISEFDSKLKKKEEALERRMGYSLQAQIDEQISTIDSKNNELEKLKIENEKLIRKLDVSEVQNKIKDQKIEDLNNLLNKKKVKKKK
jgi:chromosome segregation ATPase